jgi:DNA (cytosine-5)-methyltransferase 1
MDRFGKIIFINSDAEKAHVQWLSHGSAIHLEEAFDPQELFLTDICDSIDLRTIAGKVTVHRLSMFPHPAITNGEFFYK